MESGDAFFAHGRPSQLLTLTSFIIAIASSHGGCPNQLKTGTRSGPFYAVDVTIILFGLILTGPKTEIDNPTKRLNRSLYWLCIDSAQVKQVQDEREDGEGV